MHIFHIQLFETKTIYKDKFKIIFDQFDTSLKKNDNAEVRLAD